MSFSLLEPGANPNVTKTSSPLSRERARGKKKHEENKKWFQGTRKVKGKVCEGRRLKNSLRGTRGGQPPTPGMCPGKEWVLSPSALFIDMRRWGIGSRWCSWQGAPPLSLLVLVAWKTTLAMTSRRLMNRSGVYCALCYKHLRWSWMKVCLKNNIL